MKSCFEELHFLFGSQNQGSGVLQNFQAAEGLHVKEITHFDGNLC